MPPLNILLGRLGQSLLPNNHVLVVDLIKILYLENPLMLNGSLSLIWLRCLWGCSSVASMFVSAAFSWRQFGSVGAYLPLPDMIESIILCTTLGQPSFPDTSYQLSLLTLKSSYSHCWPSAYRTRKLLFLKATYWIFLWFLFGVLKQRGCHGVWCLNKPHGQYSRLHVLHSVQQNTYILYYWS